MSGDVLSHCLLLGACDGLSRRDAVRLLQASDSPGACLEAGPEAWCAAGLAPRAAEALARLRDAAGRALPGSLAAARERLAAVDAGVVTVCDAAYPALLRVIDTPPPWLFLRGRAATLERPQLAVVGSRRASPLGLRAAGELAGQLAAAGLVVTSGLALGIDAAAHRGALALAAATVAVLPTGVDAVYPRRHAALAEAILEQGCLVSELPPGTPPLRGNFPRRNRIISGLALGTLVVEAALPSGSLLTAASALEQGREVFALPWSIHHGGGRGCLQLLRDGAVLVQDARDITDNLGWYRPPPEAPADSAPPRPPAGASALAASLLARLDTAAVDAQTLAAATGEPLPAVLAALSELEIAGALRRCAAGYLRCR
jgi:DNA processing protein